jgi:hypothetical protein
VEAPASADMPQMRTRTTRTHGHALARTHKHTCMSQVVGLCDRVTSGFSHHAQQPAHTVRHSGVHPRPPAVQRPQRATRCRRALVAAVAPQPHLPHTHTHTHEPQRRNAENRFDGDHTRCDGVEGVMHTRWRQRWRDSTAMGTPATTQRIITRDRREWREQAWRACNTHCAAQDMKPKLRVLTLTGRRVSVLTGCGRPSACSDRRESLAAASRTTRRCCCAACPCTARCSTLHACTASLINQQRRHSDDRDTPVHSIIQSQSLIHNDTRTHARGYTSS